MLCVRQEEIILDDTAVEASMGFFGNRKRSDAKKDLYEQKKYHAILNGIPMYCNLSDSKLSRIILWVISLCGLCP